MRPLTFLVIADRSSNLKEVVREAAHLLSKVQTNTQFEDSINKLAHRVNQLTLSDVYLKEEFIENQNRLRGKGHPNSLYISIFEDVYISVGIFILKSGTKIPIHDHPLMYGILKVLYGSVYIQSYSHINDIIMERKNAVCLPSKGYYYEEILFPDSHIKMYRNSPVILNATNDCVVVTPTNNIHEVRAHNGPAAFLDVLVTPYFTFMKGGESRDCTYFEEVTNDTETVILKKSKIPSDFVTKVIPFEGPELPITF